MSIHLRAFSLLLVAVALLVASSVTGQGGREEPLMRVRIETSTPSALAIDLERRGYDVLHTRTASELELVVSREEIDQLARQGLQVRILERGRPLQRILHEREVASQTGVRGTVQSAAVPAGYRDLNGVLSRMREIAAANPAIAQFVDLTAAFGLPTTFEGRHLFALKISKNVAANEDQPRVLIVSTHHAREISTPVIGLDAAERLTSGYGIDSRITAAVDNNEIWIAPVWNPDGYNQVFVGDNLWRKNRRVFSNGIGVDQNRNYPQGWTAPCAGSTAVSSGTFKGPSAGSEAETQAMMAWSQAVRFAKVIDFHSTGRETLFAFLCSGHPFTSWMRDEAIAISEASSYGGAIRPPSAEGEHPEWQFAQMGAYAFLTETQTAFQPPFSGAVSEAARVWPGILKVIDRPIPLSGHVTDAATGAPVSAKIELLNVTFPSGQANGSGGAFGAYHFFGPTGSYNIRFSAPGHQPETRTVAVDTNRATVLDIHLSGGGNTAIFSDDFETDQAWQVNPNGTDTATTGRWERGDPEPTNSNGPKQLGITTSGTNALVTGRLAGASAGVNDIDAGITSIRSPSIALPATGNLTLSFNFYMAHGSNSSSDDFFRVTVVGSTTQTVFEKRGAALSVNAVWTAASVSLSPFAGQSVRIVIEAADNAAGSLVEAAVDDVRITRQ